MLAFTPGKWLDHCQKHAAEFEYQNAVQYLRGAQQLTQGGEGILQLTRKNGDTLFYKPATNEFAVLAQDGKTIRTYFYNVMCMDAQPCSLRFYLGFLHAAFALEPT